MRSQLTFYLSRRHFKGVSVRMSLLSKFSALNTTSLFCFVFLFFFLSLPSHPHRQPPLLSWGQISYCVVEPEPVLKCDERQTCLPFFVIPFHHSARLTYNFISPYLFFSILALTAQFHRDKLSILKWFCYFVFSYCQWHRHLSCIFQPFIAKSDKKL